MISDFRTEFTREFVFPAVQAHALYEGEYLMGTSLARPVIAKEQVRVALAHGADCVAHGATGKGNDQVRFELTYQALAPELKILAPWRSWEFGGRTELIQYSHDNGIPVTSTAEKPYSIDQNIMHTSYEGGILEDPWSSAPGAHFSENRLAATGPRPGHGNPARLRKRRSGRHQRPVPGALGLLGGIEPAGRRERRRQGGPGGKPHGRDEIPGVYETPGATILHKAHRALESLTLDREVAHFKDTLIPKIAELIYYGFWFSPEMELLLGMISDTQERVTGEVRLNLYKGSVPSPVVARLSVCTILVCDLREGRRLFSGRCGRFIRLQGLRLKIASAKGFRRAGTTID